MFQTITSEVLEKQLNWTSFAVKEIMFISNFQGCSVNQNVSTFGLLQITDPFSADTNTKYTYLMAAEYTQKFQTTVPLFSICAYRTHISHTIKCSFKEPYTFQPTNHHHWYLSCTWA
jgi:hypothetical protein